MLGLVSLRLAAEVAPEERGHTTVADIMLPVSETLIVSPETPMADALDRLRSGPGRAVVTQDGRILGIVSASDVSKAVEVERARGHGLEPPNGRSTRQVWAVVGLAFVLAAAIIYRPPLVVISPGRAVDVTDDITIDGVPTERPNGRFLLVAVHVTQTNALMAAYAFLNPDFDVLPRSQVVGGRGISDEEYLRSQLEVFRESRMAAAAAAAAAAGMDVEVTGRGAVVRDVLQPGPATGRLRRGDVVTAIDGAPVRTSLDLRRVTTSRPPGTEFELGVQRGGRTIPVRVVSAVLNALEERITGIGILATTRDLDVNLPFEVRFRERSIGGPSAGLAYALAIADMLDPRDLARGRTIAASGTIQLDGDVGPVGGLDQKAESAGDARADLFLVPREELREVSGEDVHGVERLEDALAVLAA
ncbi:MAG: PDZ domain-containing protein, partial [Actinomycetota bacterium]|nr:PDZ domain-containing protein [Actinomycetota bacterium]